MRFQVIIPYVSLLVISQSCVVGCSDRLSDPPQKSAQTDPPQQVAQADPFPVKLAALQHMFDKFAPLAGEKSAAGFECFIIESGADAQRLTAAFSDFRFPVLGPASLSHKGQSTLDRQAGKSAMRWKVEVKTIQTDRVVVYVEWYMGLTGAAGYTLNLSKEGTGWTVVTMQEEWMS